MFKRLVDLIVFFVRGGVPFARRIGVNIGEKCRIYSRFFGSEPFLITLGDNVTITAGVSFITHDGSLGLFTDTKGRRYKYQRIFVGNNVFIGVNSIIMPGVRVEDNVIVAAGSVVTKSIPTGKIVAGVPAKIVGEFNELKERSLETCVSQNEIDFSESYEQRVIRVLDNTYKPFLNE